MCSATAGGSFLAEFSTGWKIAPSIRSSRYRETDVSKGVVPVNSWVCCQSFIGGRGRSPRFSPGKREDAPCAHPSHRAPRLIVVNLDRFRSRLPLPPWDCIRPALEIGLRWKIDGLSWCRGKSTIKAFIRKPDFRDWLCLETGFECLALSAWREAVQVSGISSQITTIPGHS